jgi:cellulose synthase/poly-beta-1,6-N-acetylglucosamine synthase-like glycosyltransferase
MYLPKPPSDCEKYLYTDQNKTFLYFFGVVSISILLAGMLLFTISSLPLYLPFVVLLSTYLGASYWVGIMGGTFKTKLHEYVLMTYKFTPTVDVFLPCCGEPVEIIENTYKNVALLDYPKDKLKVYVLDDKGSSEVKQLAEKYGFDYISRPNRGELKKAGNIRYAFAQTTGEYILILDADFCPRPDMLNEMLPYFLIESDVAIVQSPQFFEVVKEANWIQNGAAYVQELFYRLIQVNRSSWNASICVGTCAIYSRQALSPHGGTAPIGYSEDLHTGFQAVLDGYKIKYLPINLSKGVCPDTFSGFVNQQYRWCTGSFTLFLNPKFWKAKLGAGARVCYLTGMLYYIATALGVLFVPMPTLFMAWFHPEGVFWYNVLFAIPSFLYGTFGLALWSKGKWGFYAVKSRQLSYWSHLLAIYDRLKNQTAGWVPTGSANIKVSGVGVSSKVKQAMIFWSYFTAATLIAGVLFNGLSHGIENFIPGLIFTILNSYITLSAAAGEGK